MQQTMNSPRVSNERAKGIQKVDDLETDARNSAGETQNRKECSQSHCEQDNKFGEKK